MNKYNLINEFFTSSDEAIKFFLQLRILKVANEDASCMASLEKNAGKWTYIIKWKDGKFIGEHLKPFRPSKENIDKFHKGCQGFSNLLEKYIETNDISIVENTPSPFGDMVYDGK